jgi:hypothetical protein
MQQNTSYMTFHQTLREKITLTKTLLATATIVMVCTAATAIINTVDFSGEWKLNETKSDLGQFNGRGAAKKIKIDAVQADSMSFERTSTNQAGEEVVRKEKLTFDGKETENASFGTSKKKSTAKWSDDGSSLVINSTILFDRNGDVTEIKQKETWKLTDNGQALSIESNSSSSFGENSMKLVYDKVK